jgi:3-hydroxyacyl-CoA dehydrogenase/enoyl-CoA hydratase/3-hydroxybutyryl-CoA epimerase
VIVKDVAGFLVNRILGPYLDEAVRLFLDGADVQKVDRLLVDFGMPMGPFRLLDEVGLDIAKHAGESLHQAYGERMEPASGLEALSSESRLGRKTGKGFYDYPKDRKEKPTPCTDLASFQTRTVAKNLPKEDVVDRLVLSMVNEGLLCLQENVVAGPQELDLATVFGTGFAPFEGGLYSYAQRRGLQNIQGRLLELGKKPLF